MYRVTPNTASLCKSDEDSLKPAHVFTAPIRSLVGHQATREASVEELQEMLGSKYALPAGLGLLALMLFLIGSASNTPFLAVLGVVAVIGAVATMARNSQLSSPPVPCSTPPFAPPVRQQHLQDHLSMELAHRLGQIESVTPYTAVVVY